MAAKTARAKVRSIVVLSMKVRFERAEIPE
jgi:hypothetical protein